MGVPSQSGRSPLATGSPISVWMPINAIGTGGVEVDMIAFSGVGTRQSIRCWDDI